MAVVARSEQRGAPGSVAEGPGLGELGDWRARPVSMAHEHVLPVAPPLAPLLPDGALSRGSTVAVSGAGATSLALALVAGPVAAGSWAAVVGVPSVGWAAAAEAGLPFERLVVVDPPPADRWATVVAALIGAFDVIVVAPRHRVRIADARRLASRARERGTVLVQLPSPGVPGSGVPGSGVPGSGVPGSGVPGSATPASKNRSARGGLEIDIRLHVDEQRWVGLGEGHGHLRDRQVEVSTSGRRRAARPRHATLHLPLTLAPVTHEPVTHEPVTHEPVTHEPVTHEPVTHEPVTHEPVTSPVELAG